MLGYRGLVELFIELADFSSFGLEITDGFPCETVDCIIRDQGALSFGNRSFHWKVTMTQ